MQFLQLSSTRHAALPELKANQFVGPTYYRLLRCVAEMLERPPDEGFIVVSSDHLSEGPSKGSTRVGSEQWQH